MKNDVITDPARAAGTGGDAARPRARGRLLWPPLAAVGAGLSMLLAFPPYGAWPLGVLGVAGLAVVTHRRGFWAGAGLGLLAGLALLIPLLSWAGGFVGPVWLFLPVGESFYFALLGGLSALVSPLLSRRLWAWPMLIGSLWVLQEALRDRTPFGGFPWGRLAFSQANSPLLPVAAIGGVPMLTFCTAALGGVLAIAGAAAIDPAVRARLVLLVRPASADPRPASADPGGGLGLRWAAGALVVTIAALTGLVWIARAGTVEDGVVRVAIVQGNVPRLGFDFNAQRLAVLNNHVDGTLALADRVARGQETRPDLVIWPENASDRDPIINADANARINQAARAIGVPILVGGLLEGPGRDEIRNVGIVWDPVTGPGQTYVKQHPVPFAEYMPIRSFARLLTDKVDLVSTDFTAGTTPGVMRVGPATIGDVICFEVAYDNIVQDTVSGGAQLLVVQTNNATFDAAEARQQLAMVRIRAVEHGRPALMASTVGVSGFVDDSGNVYDATQFNAEAVIARDVTLRTGRTMATRLGLLPELALAGVAVSAVVAAVVLRRRRGLAHLPRQAQATDEAKG